MSKKKMVKTNALRLLDQKKVAYEERTFEVPEETHTSAANLAKKLGMPLEEIYKTLVVVGNKTGPLVAVIPSNESVDFKKLAKISGNKKVELLHLNDLETTTGYIRGGCSPVGMKKLFPTFINSSAMQRESIYVSAGKKGLQMKINPQDLSEIVRGKFVDIIEE